MGGEAAEGQKRKHSKEKKEKHHKKEKKHHKRRRRSSSASSASDSGGGPETGAQELVRLRACASLLRDLLRAFPAVRKDLRALLWSVDAGQGVDVGKVADAALRSGLESLFTACRLRRTPAGFVAPPGATPLLRSFGAVFDERLEAVPPPADAPAKPTRHVPLGPARPAREQVYSGPAPEGLDEFDSDDERARRPVPAPPAEARSPVRDIGPQACPPAAYPSEAPAAAPPRRVLGPAAPPRELLASACAQAEAEAVGPAPPELVAEADAASAESREQAVARLLGVLGGGGDAYALLGCAASASAGEVRKAFWRASLLVHPDKCAHPRAGDAFAALVKAKDLLGDATQRAALDERREDAQLRAQFQAELAGRLQAAQWRSARGLAQLPGDQELLALGAGQEGAEGGREAWMTQLPPERQVRSAADAPTVVRSVTAFSRTERTGRGDAREWTETPQERAERARGGPLMLAAAERGALEAAAAAQTAGDTAGLVDAYNSAARPKTLMELHTEKLRAGARPGKQAGPTPAFDRDRDFAAPRGAPVTLKDVQQEALSGRFAGGSSQRRTFL